MHRTHGSAARPSQLLSSRTILVPFHRFSRQRKAFATSLQVKGSDASRPPRVTWYQQSFPEAQNRQLLGSDGEDPETSVLLQALREKIARLEEELGEARSDVSSNAPGPKSLIEPLLEHLSVQDRQKVRLALQQAQLSDAEHAQVEAESKALTNEVIREQLGDLGSRVLRRIEMDELEVDMQLAPQQQKAHLKHFNTCLKAVANHSLDKKARKALWISYERCKRFIPSFIQCIPYNCWTVLWDNQQAVPREDGDQTSHLKVLAQDIAESGKQLTEDQRATILDHMIDEGRLEEARKEWEMQRRSDMQIADKCHGSQGVRLFSSLGDLEQACTIAEMTFDAADPDSARCFIPVIEAWAKRESDSDIQKAWDLYLSLRTKLQSKIKMKDFDRIAICFINAGRIDVALAVFKDMSLCGKETLQGTNQFYKTSLNLLKILHAKSMSESEISTVSLSALATLPNEYANKFFYGSWIKKLIGLGEVDAAVSVVELMYERGVRPDAKHVNGIIGAWLRSNNPAQKDKAEQLGWAMIQQRLRFVNMRQRKAPTSSTGEDAPLRVRVPSHVRRVVPSATIETFSLLLLYYERRRDTNAVEELKEHLDLAEIPPNAYFMNHLLYAELRRGRPGGAWQIFERMKDYVKPDLETFACLWDCEKAYTEKGYIHPDDEFPGPRAIFHQFSTWHAGLGKAGRIAAREDFSEGFYNQIIRCMCLAKDMEGTLVALYALKELFEFLPDEETLRLIPMQIARIGLEGVRTARGERRSRLSDLAGKKAQMTRVSKVLDLVVEQRIVTLDRKGVKLEHCSPRRQKEEQLYILADFLHVVLRKSSAARSITGQEAPSAQAYIQSGVLGGNKNLVDVKKVIVIGSGGLSIGQAGEFDYSGSQALKALKEANVVSVLINPNIATIQTDHKLADEVYYLPVTPEYVTYVIEREKPDGILLTFGGQTALNLGVKMEDMGIFERYGVKVLGTSIDTLKKSEDRDLFAKALKEINIPIAESIAVSTVDEALAAAKQIGYPIISRSAYALGGLGSGFANDEEELKNLSSRSLTLSPQILIEKSLKGWKELEYEVVRDAANNCITVCNMENFDPLGTHTGDSIVVAPSQTLSDEEYHMLRTAAIKIIRHLGVVGECNVQYALQPDGLDYRVIEVNARLSRSSALASKATGYPLAYTAAKIGLGHTLPELPNAVTKTTTANFEPSLDYIVTKIPRWDLSKFQHVRRDIGSSMKSVGEVMAIGRTFEESFQKAIRQVDPRFVGFQGDNFDDLDEVLRNPTDRRWLAVGQAMLHEGYSVDRVHELSKIDKWFLYKLQNIVDVHHELTDVGSLFGLKKELVSKAKKMGFSDKQIAQCVGSSEDEVRARRKGFGIRPFVKKIDTLAAEFPADTNYLYTTYNATSHDVKFDDHGTIILGSGVYRIGSSVEFDWCAVNATLSLKEMGKKTVMINTFSTDFDTADKLYFEELSYERVMDIYELESANGVVVSVGGQLPQNIALRLQETGKAHVLGTDPKDIDKAEDRHKFSQILDSIGVDQPAWKELASASDAERFAEEVGYPVLVRPSYVLSGAAMSVIRSPDELKDKLISASAVSPDYPVVISKFIEGAQEIDVDAVGSGGKLILHAVSEHVEPAGVHSGDATLVLPPVNLDESILARVKEIAEKVARAWNITGPFNMQIIKSDDASGGGAALKVIECNLRASRSFPFVSKVLGTNFIDVATKALIGRDVPEPVDLMAQKRDYLATKVPQFSWTRLAGADPFLGVEMASTGEIACFGKDLIEAYWTSLQSTMNFRMPEPGEGLLFGGDTTKPELTAIVDYLKPLGYKFFAANELVKEHLESSAKEGASVGVIEFSKTDKRLLRETFQKYDIRGVFNLASQRGKTLLDEDYVMRRNAVDFGVPLFMEPKVDRFTPEVLLSAPRRGSAVPDSSGKLAVYTVSTYSFESHQKTSEIRVINISNGRSTLVTNEKKTSEPNWLEDASELLWLKEGMNGATELVVGSVEEVGSTYVAGVVPGSISNVKLKPLSPGRTAIAVTGKAQPNGTLYNEEKEPKIYTTARLYDRTMVRHWDEYVAPQTNAIWYGELERSNGKWSLGSLTNALKETGLESPIPTFGGKDDFDISFSGLVFVAKDPVLNPAFNTKCNFYYVPIGDFSHGPASQPQRLELEALQGAASSPVLSPDGKSAAFLQMEQNGYESDKNRIVHIPVIASMLQADGSSRDAQALALNVDGHEWDRSPSSVTFSPDGTMLLLVVEDKGDDVLFKIDLIVDSNEPERHPQGLTGAGAVSDVQPLKIGSNEVFVSSTSLVDNSIYAIVDPTQSSDPQIVSSNSKDGLSFGLSSEQVSEVWFQGAGDYQVHALVVKPSNFSEDQKYPLAYMIHGGPQGAWTRSWSTRWNPAVFAEQGYVVICPNPTGSTGYGQTFVDAITGSWGGLPYEDLVKGFEYIKETLPYVDTDRAVALGASYGGYMMNWIQGHPLGRAFKALVCHDGVFSMTDQLSSDEQYFPNHDLKGPYWDTKETWENWDPSRFTGNWSTPMLVIHNALDYRLPISEGLAMFNVLQERGIESRFLTFSDENHWVLKEENSLVWHTVVLNWINNFVGLPPYKDVDPVDPVGREAVGEQFVKMP
ncbi:MAG: hypothetical protein Q9228_001140 [Teloschistes exilis]